jgi:hypothetical protein
MDTLRAKNVLVKCVQNSLPVLLVGAPGVGKSDLVAEVSAELGYELLVSHPVVAEPVDAKGLPYPDKDGQTARFLPYGDLARALAAKVPTVWFLDDLGQAAPDVQASFMQLLLARRIGEHKLPDCVTFVAATNRREDRAGVNGLLEPVKSRFATIVELTPSVDAWVDWALDAGMPSELIAFIRFRPELLCKPAPSLNLVNSPSPRTWANLGRLMQIGLDPDEEQEVYVGAVGHEAAVEFLQFLRVWRELPSPDSILLDPQRAPIPDSPSTLYALTSALAQFTTKENFSRVLCYAERMQQDGKGEFAAYLLRDAERKHPEIKETAAYVMAVTGPLGELFK